MQSGSLALIGAGTFALLKLDEGFADFMESASVKVGLRVLFWGS